MRTQKLLEKLLLGKIAKADHPVTALDPNGRNGFVIKEVLINYDGHVSVRGDNTMWVGFSVLLEITDPRHDALVEALQDAKIRLEDTDKFARADALWVINTALSVEKNGV